MIFGQLGSTAATGQSSSFAVESHGLKSPKVKQIQDALPRRVRYGNLHARSGLRYLDEARKPAACDPQKWAATNGLGQGKRQFFRLAVQQAEAAYGIQAPLAPLSCVSACACLCATKAKHPLFFTWTQDPLMLVTSKVPALYKQRIQVTRHTWLNG